MFSRNKKTITVKIKLYSGLHKEITAEGYDPYNGMDLAVPEGMRIKHILASIGLKGLSSNAYFIAGARKGLWSKPEDGDEIICIKPSAGG